MRKHNLIRHGAHTHSSTSPHAHTPRENANHCEHCTIDSTLRSKAFGFPYILLLFTAAAWLFMPLPFASKAMA